MRPQIGHKITSSPSSCEALFFFSFFKSSFCWWILFHFLYYFVWKYFSHQINHFYWDEFYHYFLSFIYVLFFDFHNLGGSPNRGRGGGPNKRGSGGRGGRFPSSPRNFDLIEDSIGTILTIKVLKFLHLEIIFLKLA